MANLRMIRFSLLIVAVVHPVFLLTPNRSRFASRLFSRNTIASVHRAPSSNLRSFSQ